MVTYFFIDGLYNDAVLTAHDVLLRMWSQDDFRTFVHSVVNCLHPRADWKNEVELHSYLRDAEKMDWSG
jgi:hypothetical protein